MPQAVETPVIYSDCVISSGRESKQQLHFLGMYSAANKFERQKWSGRILDIADLVRHIVSSMFLVLSYK